MHTSFGSGLDETGGPGTTPHSPTKLSLAALRHVNHNRMLRLLIHLRTISITPSQHVPASFNDHKLEAKTDAQDGDVGEAGVVDGAEFALGPTISEATGNNHTTIINN